VDLVQSSILTTIITTNLTHFGEHLKLSEKTRIVVDTNILLDIIFFEDPHVEGLKNALENGQLEAWSCDLIWEEFLDVMRRPAFYKNEETYQKMIEKALKYFQFEVSKIPPSTYKCRDPDDQTFIDLAVIKAPCWLISRDLEVLKLAKKLKLVNVEVTSNKKTKLSLTPPWESLIQIA
jgi:predicted nucleic acid-binding protein